MNLLSLLQDQVGSTLAQKASSFLGESEDNTKSALSGIMPTLLGSLISKGSSESGASGLLNMITSGGHNGGILDNIGGLFSGGDSTSGLMSTGSGILSSLLGDKLGGITQQIARFSGVSESSSSSLMKMAAPMMMGMLGKQVSSQGLNAAGLMNLLGSQKDFVKSAMPSGLSGLGGLLGFADNIKETVSNVGGKAVEVGGDVVEAGAKAGGSILRWLLPVLLVLLALGYFGIRTGCSAVDNAADTVTNTTGDVVDKAGDVASNVADKAGDAVDKVKDALTKVTLPGGAEISYAANSFGEKVVNFLNGDEKNYETAFTFDGLTFETGSANLTEASKTQLDNLAAILTAYPDTKIRIEGHTDNTGDAANNKKLSLDRANTVKNALLQRKVVNQRIEAIGYGQEKPIADNTTDEGKEANRRVDLYFIK